MGKFFFQNRRKSQKTEESGSNLRSKNGRTIIQFKFTTKEERKLKETAENRGEQRKKVGWSGDEKKKERKQEMDMKF
jgi:hypothetical protein